MTIRTALVLMLAIPLAVLACSTTESIQKDSSRKDGGAPAPGDEGAAPPTSVSGTRLKAKWIAAEDGARQFKGFFDSERDVDCAFDRAADGKTRCLPTSLAVNTSWYADATCTKPLAYAYKGCVPQKTASLRETYCAGNDTPVKVFAVAGPYRGASLYTKSTIGCTASAVSPGFDSYDFFSLGAEVAPSSFVAADVTID